MVITFRQVLLVLIFILSWEIDGEGLRQSWASYNTKGFLQYPKSKMRNVKGTAAREVQNTNLSSYTHTFIPLIPPLPTYNQSGLRQQFQDPYQKTRNKMEKLGRPAASSSPQRAPCLPTASVPASISALPSGGPSGLGCSVPRVHNPGHSGNLLQFLYQTQHFYIDRLPPKSIFHH